MNDKKAANSDDENSGKMLVSVYLSAKTLDEIDDCLFYVKKRLPIDKRRKLTKSVFYEIGLRAAVEEYNSKGEDSSIWQAIYELLKK